MNLTARFAELVQGPEASLVLDEPALLIAAHDHPVAVPVVLRELDDLAASITARDAPTLARELFHGQRFAGNADDYGDPRNSYLDEVLRRRTGLPITLSVLMIEIGRRRGIPLVGVGMPGHFLVGSDDGFFDPFHAGALLDVTGARRLFDQVHPGAPFFDHYLAPIGARAVLSRMLGNLVGTFLGRDPMRATWALALRLAIPDLPDAERQRGEDTLRQLRARLN